MSAPFTFAPGTPAPRQSTRVTCGAACLTLARALRDPDVAARITTDAGFAALEFAVHAWTNGVRGPSGAQLPWPRSWGTPPWGARAALERGAAEPGTRYTTRMLRHLDGPELGAAADALVAAARPGTPVLLYVGDAATPRHVVLLATPSGASTPLVYDPATGTVGPLSREAFAGRRLHLAGWDVPWLALVPRPRP